MENCFEMYDSRKLADVSNKRDTDLIKVAKDDVICDDQLGWDRNKKKKNGLWLTFSFDLQLDLRTEQKWMKSSGFPEGEDMLSYVGHVCKRLNRNLFTIIPLVGDVRCLIPFVG